MAVTYGFYNALNHDRLYDAIQMSSIFDGIIRDGIFSTIGDCMVVSAPEDGLYVNVGSGRAWFNHTWTLNDTDYPIEAEEAEVVLDRIDAVVIEVNSAAEVRANSIKFIKGTPSSEPVKPTLIHNAEVNQYALAYVTIRAGQTTIFQQDIENVVGTDETPFITGLLQQVSIETLLTQWEAEFNTYFTNFQSTSTTEFNNWLAAKVAEYTLWYAQMQTDMDADFAEFDAWFQRMKDQLSEDAAGHLQAEIDELAEAAQKGSIVTVTTTDPTLFNRPVTISQTGFDPVTSSFDASGVAYFETVPMVGEVAIEATNGTLTAYGTLTIPYFSRYTTTLEFWEAVIDITTNLQTLYNRQITVSKDGATVGTTSFDATGHATFSVHAPGTYHLAATDSASVEHTADVVVSAETTYYVDLAGIPDGKTVLPTDDIGIWLACAEETANYTTLAEVLNDTELFARLCADSNACDYMARSTTWADGLVPKMTSNTTPSGTASQSSMYDNDNTYGAWRAFNRNPSEVDGWTSSASDSTAWMQYEFPNSVHIGYMKIDMNNRKSAPNRRTFIGNLYVGDDPNNLTEVLHNFEVQFISGTSYEAELIVNATGKYVKIETVQPNIIPSGYNYTALFGVQFYASNNGCISITEDATAMLIVGKYNYCANKLLSNSTWAIAIAESAYVDLVCDIKVPVMTSNTTPSGTVSASSYLSGYDPWKAFNPSNSSGWVPNTGSAGEYIIYEFPTAVKLSAVVGSGLQYSSSNDRTATYHLYASTDGSTYTDLNVDLTLHLDKTTKYSESITMQTAYKYIKAQVVSGEPMANQGCKLQFYGRTDNANYIPLVPVMTSNTTPSGVASSKDVYQGGYEAYKAFDGDSSTRYIPAEGTDTKWLQYQSTEPVCVNKIIIYSSDPLANIKARVARYELVGSNDGTTWSEPIATLSTDNITSGNMEFIVDNNEDAYTYHRVNEVKKASYGIGYHTVQFYSKVKGITIHSAPNDTIYYLDGSTPVTVAVTDANGRATIDIDDLDPGTYTLYSTVAKDPNNLSNAYSKTVKINGNTTEIYLMPILSLYWWGYENQSCLPYTVASGYNDGTYNTPPTLSRNTNYLSISQPWSNSAGCRGCTVYDTPVDHASKINIIIEASWYDRTNVTNYTYEGCVWDMSNTNNIADPSDPAYYEEICRNVQSMPMTKFSKDFIYTDYLFIQTVAWQHSCLAKQYALWYTP